MQIAKVESFPNFLSFWQNKGKTLIALFWWRTKSTNAMKKRIVIVRYYWLGDTKWNWNGICIMLLTVKNRFYILNWINIFPLQGSTHLILVGIFYGSSFVIFNFVLSVLFWIRKNTQAVLCCVVLYCGWHPWKRKCYCGFSFVFIIFCRHKTRSSQFHWVSVLQQFIELGKCHCHCCIVQKNVGQMIHNSALPITKSPSIFI